MNTATPRAFQLSLPFLFACTFVVWLITRWPLMVANDFPLNDGGMFAAMVEDLKQNGFRIPEFTTYNNSEIPFAYPPLAFYFGAIVSSVFQVSPVTVLCWVPFFFNLLSALAFAAFAWSFWERKSIALFSALSFLLLPRSGAWLLMGGGLTRGAGFFFALLAILFAHRVFRDGKRRDAVWSGVFSGLVLLSHLESAVLVVLSTLIFSFQGRPWRERLYHLCIIGSITAIVAAPWLVTVISQHGIAPFKAASGSAGEPRALFTLLAMSLLLTEETLPMIMLIWWIGTFIALRQRQYLLPIWILSIILFMWRSSQTQATAAIALLCGLAIDTLLRYPLRRWSPQSPQQPTQVDTPAPHEIKYKSHASLPVAMLLPCLVVIGGLTVTRLRFSSEDMSARFLTRLDKSNLEAMQWVRDNTTPQTKFLVLGPNRTPWWGDRVAEWFPYLAARRSVLTVQGTEWLPNKLFSARRRTSYRLSQAADVATLHRIANTSHQDFDVIYLDARGDTNLQNIQRQLQSSANYLKILDGPVVIFKIKNQRP